MRQVIHALLTRPPLSHSPSENFKCFVRLACVRHAASVHPEPGSNSHVKKFVSVSQDLLVFNFRLLLILGWFFIEPCSLNILLRIFKDSCYCSVINVHSVVLCDSSFSLSHLFHLVKNFFHFLFSKMFFDVAVVFATGDILS